MEKGGTFMKCPNCGGEHCQVVTEVNSYTQGFGVGKGCCGYICFGPIGLLCGLCGMGEGSSTSVTYWICQDCGRKFKA